jgi:hypothetical protein
MSGGSARVDPSNNDRPPAGIGYRVRQQPLSACIVVLVRQFYLDDRAAVAANAARGP